MSYKSLQPGDASTLKMLALIVGGLAVIMFVCIALAIVVTG